MPRVAGIPKRAKEVACFYPNGKKASAEYFIDGELVGRRWWNDDGQRSMEWTYRNGRQHGVWREWHDNGRLQFQSTYENGYEHGQALQWDEDGTLLGGYSMNMGTGIDLWWGCTGFPTEERHMKDGLPHGSERWWSRKNEVYDELEWSNGQLHGIHRRWTGRKLDRGFPQFHINHEKVTKREYLRAAEPDPTLPLCDPKDDSPRRTPLTPTRSSPAAYASDRKTASKLRAH
jgi:hypothetical protein